LGGERSEGKGRPSAIEDASSRPVRVACGSPMIEIPRPLSAPGLAPCQSDKRVVDIALIVDIDDEAFINDIAFPRSGCLAACWAIYLFCLGLHVLREAASGRRQGPCQR
jgi:hypothetical protein